MIYPELTLNSESSCPVFPSAGLAGMYLHAWKLALALDETVFSKTQVLYTDKNRTLPWPLSYSPIHTTFRSEVGILLQFCLEVSQLAA